MKNLAFVDLDKTLIFSKRSLPENLAEGAITCFQREDDEERGCWMPKAYLDFLIDNNCEIIIVTARDFSDVAKLNLPFKASYTVCNFGALIYKDSKLIKNNISDNDLSQMQGFKKYIESRFFMTPTKSHLHDSKDVVWHFIRQHEASAQMDFSLINSVVKTRFKNLVAQINGRHFDVFPRSCLKEIAVKYILDEEYSGIETFKFGMGDSVIDHGFMSLCDLAITPTASQLFNALGDK
jgi:hydroxymethylpyrimidine pyrophosphatase-like HAD family hydrolase